MPADEYASTMALRENRLIENVEMGIVKDKGEITWISVTAAPIPLEGYGVAIAYGDITERKRTEEALRETQELLTSILDNAPMLIYVTLPDNRYRLVNRGWEEFVRLTREEAVGRLIEQVFSPKTACQFMEANQQVIDMGIPVVAEAFVDRSDGPYYFHTVKFPLRDTTGKVTSVGGISFDITERKQAEEQLRNSHEQLRALSTHLQSIREEERALISREIHDELGQELAGLEMDLSWLIRRLSKNQKSLISKTESMLKLVDSTIQTVRRISSELRPGVLDDLGLIAAIEWQAQDFENRTGITCDFSSSVEKIDLDRDRSTAVFRIFQETLTNVSRHAKAMRVKISLEVDADTLILRIEDNGKGIKESEVFHPKSFGLLGMRERVLVFGGEVEISGIPKKGTSVVLKIPLER